MAWTRPPHAQRLLQLLVIVCAPIAAKCVTESGAHRQESATWEMLASLLVLMTSLFLTHALLLSKFHIFPESVATIFLGFVIGAYLHFNSKEISFLISFDPKTFFIYLLPAIIFDAGYSLHKAKFFSLIGSILAFAVFGTIISSLTVGAIVYYAGLLGFSAPLPLSHALAFGSLISSVDPVATLAIFNSVNLSSTLYMLVFGESVLNDAVAVVLFKSFSVQSDAEHANVSSAIFDFVYITLFSVGVGMTTALFSALLFKYRPTPYTRTHHFPLFLNSCVQVQPRFHVPGAGVLHDDSPVLLAVLARRGACPERHRRNPDRRRRHEPLHARQPQPRHSGVHGAPVAPAGQGRRNRGIRLSRHECVHRAAHVAPRLHPHHHRRNPHRSSRERVPHRVAAQPPRAPAAVLAGADRHVVQRAPRRHFLLSRHERAVGISSSAVHTGSRARDHRVFRGWHNAVRAVIHVLRLRQRAVTCR